MGKSEAKWGAKMLAKPINHVSDAELDMHRRGGAEIQGGTMRRVLEVLLSFHSAALAMGNPRRSIDREQQEYTPSSD